MEVARRRPESLWQTGAVAAGLYGLQALANRYSKYRRVAPTLPYSYGPMVRRRPRMVAARRSTTTRRRKSYRRGKKGKRMVKSKRNTFAKRVTRIINANTPNSQYKRITYRYEIMPAVLNLDDIREIPFAEPPEILDAVAVLYNGKPMEENPPLTGNFNSLRFDIPLNSAYKKVFFTSFAQRTFSVQCWFLKPKFENVIPPKDAWEDSVRELTNVGSFNATNPHVTLSDGDKQFQQSWTISKTKTFLMHPNQKVYIGTMALGVKNIKVEDMYTTGELNFYHKKCSGVLMYRVHRLPTPNTDNTVLMSTLQQLGILVEEHTIYKMSPPEIAPTDQQIDKFRYTNNLAGGGVPRPIPVQPDVQNLTSGGSFQ